MSTALALAVADRSAAAIITGAGYSREQVDLVKATVAKGATDMELALFLQTARRRQLDPFARQIHFVKRRTNVQDPVTGKWDFVMVGTMQTGIDGYRSIAERTGQYDGQDDAEFKYREDGKTLFSATVRVYRKDVSRPFVGTAFWDEYAQTKADGSLQPMWKRMPHVMLAKTGEALALRKAFPEQLSGLYTEDEMPPAIEGEYVEVAGGAAAQPGKVTRMNAEQRAPLANDVPAVDADIPTLRSWIASRVGVHSRNWSSEHMALVLREIGEVLGMLESPKPGDLNKENGEMLRAYVRAIAFPSARVEADATIAEQDANAEAVDDVPSDDADIPADDDPMKTPDDPVVSVSLRKALVDAAAARGLTMPELNTRIAAVTGRADARFEDVRESEYARIEATLRPAG